MVFVAILLPPLLLCMMLALGRYEEWILRPPRSSRRPRSLWRIRLGRGTGRAPQLSLVRDASPEAGASPPNSEITPHPARAAEEPADSSERPADAA